MGDRGNIYVVDQDPAHGIYLYSHWGGSDLPKWLAVTLQTPAARGRWGDGWSDSAYLTRIICSAMFGDAVGPTGFGVSTFLSDNEYPITILDLRGRVPTVWFAAEGAEQDTTEWFSPYDPLSGAPLDYPQAGEHYRVPDGVFWKYERTEQAARAWLGVNADRVQVWDGLGWADA